MNKYKIVFSKTAEKQLFKIPQVSIDKIIQTILELKEEPRPVSCKKLKGFDNLWRIRIGN
jgi:mRNA interferase RelE/StbE